MAGMKNSWMGIDPMTHCTMSECSTTELHPAPSVVDHWLEWEIAQWVHHEGSIQPPNAPWARSCTSKEGNV